MSTQHELYGEILTAKEVTQATGFTMNQLRNWRVPARRELAPFGFISIGATPYYRKVVIQDYLDEHGVQQDVYVMSDRDKKFPIAEAQVKSLGKTLGHNAISKITPENISEWMDYKAGSGVANFGTTWRAIVSEVQERLGLEKRAVTNMLKAQNPDFFVTAVHTARLFTARDQNLDISTDEVFEIPVGTVPPVKETKWHG